MSDISLISRDDISRKFCTGAGLEFGAGTTPTAVADGTIVSYVDKRNAEELKKYFDNEKVVCGESISSYATGQFDFLMAHHVLEHCSDVIGTLVAWIKYLKPTGRIFLSIPDRPSCPDRGRLVAPPTHFLQDYICRATDASFESREHIYSFAWGWHDVGGLAGTDKAEASRRIASAVHAPENDCHWHVFTFDTCKFVLNIAAAISSRDIAFLYEEPGSSAGEHRLVAELTEGYTPDEDISFLCTMREGLGLRLAQIALRRLEGLPIHSLSAADAGKIFVAEKGRLRWVREPDVLRDMGLEGRETVYLEAAGAGDAIYGPQIASATLELAEDRRAAVMRRVPLSGQGLEISPGARPLILKEDANILYCDKVDLEQFKQIYYENSQSGMDYILGDQLIDEILPPNSLDYIVSSHVIEHVPDFIQFIKSASVVLRPGGLIVSLVPDRRYTFDVLRRDSTIEDIEEAHRQKLRHPNLQMLTDVYQHIDAKASSTGLWDRTYRPSPTYSADEVADILSRKNVKESDCHCWTFTPVTCRQLLQHVAERHVPSLRIVEISDTPMPSNEFLLHLRFD